MMNIETTLVCGFLESGKTTYINNLLKGRNTDKKLLIIMCEEGIEEYIKSENTEVVYIEYSEDFNREDLKELEEKYHPDEIIVEANGTWQMQYVQPAMPFNWKVNKMVTLVDASTFEAYSKNLNSLMSEKIRLADTVYFNKVTDQLALMLRKKNLRLVNKSENMFLVFEDHTEKYDDGNLRNENFKTSDVVIEDDLFGDWFSDYSSDPKFYLGKHITISGSLVKFEKLENKQFVVGRNAMVCCANDMMFLGIMCKGTTSIENSKWVEIKGCFVENQINPEIAPFMVEVEKIIEKEEPADTTVY